MLCDRPFPAPPGAATTTIRAAAALLLTALTSVGPVSPSDAASRKTTRPSPSRQRRQQAVAVGSMLDLATQGRPVSGLLFGRSGIGVDQAGSGGACSVPPLRIASCRCRRSSLLRTDRSPAARDVAQASRSPPPRRRRPARERPASACRNTHAGQRQTLVDDFADPRQADRR